MAVEEERRRSKPVGPSPRQEEKQTNQWVQVRGITVAVEEGGGANQWVRAGGEATSGRKRRNNQWVQVRGRNQWVQEWQEEKQPVGPSLRHHRGSREEEEEQTSGVRGRRRSNQWVQV